MNFPELETDLISHKVEILLSYYFKTVPVSGDIFKNMSTDGHVDPMEPRDISVQCLQCHRRQSVWLVRAAVRRGG